MEDSGRIGKMGTLRDSADIVNVVETHSDTVLRVCSLYFHGRPERDDAYQETFLKYAQSEKEFADSEHVKAWLIRVAKNVCVDMLKRAESKTILMDEFDDTAKVSWAAGNSENPGGGGSAADDLNEALQQLDDNYRIALYLKYYEGYTAAEIAELMDMPENTVYTNLARGREKLKEVLTHGKDENR